MPTRSLEVHYAEAPPGTPLNWLKAIIAASPVGLMLVGHEQVFACSKQCEQLLGLSAEEILSAARLVARVRHPDGTPYRREELCFVQALEHGETVAGKLMVVERPGGTTRLLSTNARPVRDDGGSVVGAVIMVEDVTLRRETEDKLRASEALLRAVIDILPVGVWIADHEGRITLGNPAGQRIWKGARYVGVPEFGQYKGWWLESGKPIAAEDWAIARAVKQGETSNGELIRIQCFDGSYKIIINSAAPIRDPDGALLGAIGVNEDITALHEAQEKLRAAVLDRERILAVVAHDLRNPLAGLMIWAGVLREQASPDLSRTLGPLLDVLLTTTRRMSGLVDDLLAVAVAPTGRTLLKRSRIPARELLEQAVAAARPALSREGLTVDVQATGDLPSVEVDVDRVLRVFANLVDNALKFTEPYGTVTFGAEPVSGSVRFSVANSGPAISQAQRQMMFEPFWQAGRDDRRGVGLGMAICRSVIEAHGGTIWAEPASGQRLRVCFDLPRWVGNARP